MYAIEFETRVKNGTIQVPEEYQGQLKSTVRVIILMDSPSSTGTLIDRLLEEPLQVADFHPLTRDEIHARG